MKRLVWLVLAVFGTALAQVSPVEVPVTKQATCPCCRDAGDCGMPDCVPTTTNPLVHNLQSPAMIARVAAKRVAAAPRGQKETFYVRFESRPVQGPACHACVVLASAASGPLFKAHCSYLL